MLFQRRWFASWAHHVDVCVFYFRVRASCSRHGVCPSVNICWRREESLCLNSFVMKNFQDTWCSCFLLVCMAIRIIPQSVACFGAKLKSMRRTPWQSGKSWHLCRRRWPFIFRFSIVSLFPRSCCEEVCSWASLWLFILQFKESPSWGCGFRKLRLAPQFEMFAKRLLCRWRIFCPSIAFFNERGYRGFGQSSPSFAGSVNESTFGRAVLHWGCCLFLCLFGVRVGLAALSQSMLGVFWRVSTVYG